MDKFHSFKKKLKLNVLSIFNKIINFILIGIRKIKEELTLTVLNINIEVIQWSKSTVEDENSVRRWKTFLIIFFFNDTFQNQRRITPADLSPQFPPLSRLKMDAQVCFVAEINPLDIALIQKKYDWFYPSYRGKWKGLSVKKRKTLNIIPIFFSCTLLNKRQDCGFETLLCSSLLPDRTLDCHNFICLVTRSHTLVSLKKMSLRYIFVICLKL